MKKSNKFSVIVLVLLILILGTLVLLRVLANKPAVEDAPKADSGAVAEQLAKEPDPPAESEPEPDPEPTPEPIPEVESEPGVPVYLDGTLIDDTVYVDEVLYANAEDMRQALDVDFWSEYMVDGVNTMDMGALIRSNGRDYAAVEELCARYNIRLYDEPEVYYATSAAGQWTVPSGYSVPILMYHGVSDADLWTDAELFVSTGELRDQIQWLQEHDFEPIWFSDLKHVDSLVESGKKPVLLTFDDGWLDTYTDAFPILQEYNAKATYFIVTGNISNNANVLRADQVRELSESGLVDIQYHTDWHLDLDELSYDKQVEELTWGKPTIMKMTGKIPYALAYPEGRQNNTTLEICRDEFNFAVKMSGPMYVTGQGDQLLIYRQYVPRGTSGAGLGGLVGG